MNRILSADFIFTNTGEPLPEGGLEVDGNGMIINVLPKEKLKGKKNIERYEGFIVPGFVNAHCHLELSFAAGKIEKGKGIDNFIARLEGLKKSSTRKEKIATAHRAVEEMETEGIVAVGDICNTSITAEVKNNTKIKFRNFIEVYGLEPEIAMEKLAKARQLQKAFPDSSITPHSTYSLSEELFKLIAKETKAEDILSIHHQESEAENQYFKEGNGAMAERFARWGLPLPSFIPSGKRPIETISEVFAVASNPMIFVHNTFSRDEDIKFIMSNYRSPSLCLCPSSNLFIEKSLPDVNIFSEEGINICLGTDSLASTDKLSILNEIKILQNKFQNIDLSELIKWGSLNGAKALKLENSFGSFEKGKTPGINLLKNVDKERRKLKQESHIEKLF